ncbi:MAG: 30S ribosomal protein S7 [Desulfobulbaceae bacterium]|jgi:small subunit ribosomal protein S7|nr:30S ribosomal protein S7 [Desulfobulbaceae bacterium]HKJ14781.1 30S ribosomal protein S7 [Desulfobulbales bacterium]MDH3541560.1 30S ribosomal protein S7 [Desulfobulbaceae bacterium]MDH3775736.1 30S ribosomal protein S7 [Desulfobulbaceae bacterium]MDH3781654.1 30S ribosomal protein S7 [Desulfobulbaceae bacterium]
MPRRKIAERRTIEPDPRFNSVLVSKFTNGIMERGKRSVAQKIFYGAMDIIEQQVTDAEAIAVFDKAMEMVRPKVEVKSRRVGGATYQVPVEVRPERRNALAIRWIISFAKSRPGKTMSEKLAAELMDAYHERGGSVKKRDDTHRMAEANKAFAHYRW